MKPSYRLKSHEDILRIADSGDILRGLFAVLQKLDIAGISTWELDTIIDDFIIKKHARPAFKTLPDYTYASCISVNEEIIHGIPSKKRKLLKGDIVSIDTGAVLNGFFSDACITIPVGQCLDNHHAELLSVARKVCDMCCDVLHPGNTAGDMGEVVQAYLNGTSFIVMHQFSGHGVGYALHEPPMVPFCLRSKQGLVFKEGMVLAIEPVLKYGTSEVSYADDGWTAIAVDGCLSAQFEHTVAVTAAGPLILT